MTPKIVSVTRAHRNLTDNRGPETRITVSLSTEAVVKRAKSIKSIMAVIDYRAFDVERGASLRQIALILGALLKPNFDYTQSILFVITHASASITPKKVMFKIEKLIVAETKRLEEEKAKRYRMNHNVMGMTKSSKDEDDEQEIHDLINKLTILNLMKEKADNIQVINIFDEGQSRQHIIKRLKQLQPVPKDKFDFSEADSVRRNFRDAVSDDMAKAIKEMEHYQALPHSMDKFTLEVNEAKKSVTVYQSQIEDIKSGREFKGEQDPIVIANKQKLIENKESIVTKQKEASELGRKIKGLERQLWPLDTTEEIEFWSFAQRKKRSSNMKKTGSDVANVGAVFFETEDDGFLAAAYNGTFGLAFALASTVISTPISLLVRGLERIDFPIEYEGAPFTRVEEIARDGKIKRNKYEPGEGLYKAKYESNRGSTADANVIVYGQKCMKPDNKTKIEELKKEIGDIETQTDILQIDIARLNEANRGLEQSIQEFIKGDKKDSKIKLQGLEKVLSTAQANVAGKEKELESIVLDLQQLGEKLAKDKSYFDIIEEIAFFMEFNTDNYPDLTERFIKLHHSLQNKTISASTKSTSLSLNTGSQHAKVNPVSIQPTPSVVASKQAFFTTNKNSLSMSQQDDNYAQGPGPVRRTFNRP